MQFKARGKQTDVMCLDENSNHVVVGCAGSGKSICALLRAKYLKNMSYETIILSFNNTLANYLNDLSDKEITTSTVIKFMKRRIDARYPNKEFRLLDHKDFYLKQALRNISNKNTELKILKDYDFIFSEIVWIQRMGIVSKGEYQRVERIGRNTSRVSRENRPYVYKVYEEYQKLRMANGFSYDFDDIGILFNELINTGKLPRESLHIIIDEGQDFSPVALRALVNYVQDAGSVIYFGDTAQQIYGSRFSWKNMGLKVRKVYTLNENYRNSKGILLVCNALRKEMGLDAEEIIEAYDVCNGNNEKPMLFECASVDDERSYIYNYLVRHPSRGSVGILTHTNPLRNELYEYLRTRGLKVRKLMTTSNYEENCIYIGTYHSAKGFEFDEVILPYCTRKNFRYCTNGTNSEEESELALKKLLYVGVSRAKSRLLVTASPQVTKHLKDIDQLFKIVG